MIDKQVRALVEYEVKHRCVKNFGIRGFFVRLMMLSPSLFVKVKVWYPMKEKIDSQFFRGDKKLFKLYDTFALTFLDEDENEYEKTRNNRGCCQCIFQYASVFRTVYAVWS